MMKFSTPLTGLLLLILIINSSAISINTITVISAAPAASERTCMICTLLVGIVERQALSNSYSIQQAVNSICTNINSNGSFDFLCELVTAKLTAMIAADYSKGLTPDQTCRNYKDYCSGDAAQCTLFTQWPPAASPPSAAIPARTAHTAGVHSNSKLFSEIQLNDISSIIPPSQSKTGDKWVDHYTELLSADKGLSSLQSIMANTNYKLSLKKLNIESATVETIETGITGQELLIKKQSVHGDIGKHHPLFDSDNDNFSTIDKLRGADWRGKDCNDADNTIYPGRIPNQDQSADTNCNGISGVNSAGESYESLYCTGSGQRGIISIGDSATAHFSIPPILLSAPITNLTFQNLIPLATDEADWPHCSWSTGHSDPEVCPIDYVGVTSVYQQMRARNLCMHRDYQNLGVNGGRSTNNAPPNGNIMAIARNAKLDQPVTVFYSLIGNDVCNGHHTFDTMTPPDVFHNATLASLNYLDSILPSGSTVLISGLVDGRVLYQTVSNRIHPIGENYTTFYNYLNCVHSSPCWGWMNDNSTVRDLTTAHAFLLNSVYQSIVSTNTFNNIQVQYVFIDFQSIVNQWIKDGNDPMDLIEHTDGFHPSQTSNSLIANYVFQYLLTNQPAAVGKINPNNQNIINQFGANLNGY